MPLPLIPDKMPQDFDSRPYAKRIEWWNIFFQAVNTAIQYIWKNVTNTMGKVNVDGVDKNMKCKVISGNLDSSADFAVTHAMDASKILYCIPSMIYPSNGLYYTQASGADFRCYWAPTGTQVHIQFGYYWNGAKFLLTIFYYE